MSLYWMMIVVNYVSFSHINSSQLHATISINVMKKLKRKCVIFCPNVKNIVKKFVKFVGSCDGCVACVNCLKWQCEALSDFKKKKSNDRGVDSAKGLDFFLSVNLGDNLKILKEKRSNEEIIFVHFFLCKFIP